MTKNLGPKLLLGNEFLHPHQGKLDYKNCAFTIGSCEDLVTLIRVLTKGPRIKRKAPATKDVVVPPRKTVAVPVMCIPLLRGRQFIFSARHGAAHDAIVDEANFVAVTNSGPSDLLIKRKARLGMYQEYEEDGCFLVEQTSEESRTTSDETAAPAETDTTDPEFAEQLKALAAEFTIVWTERGPIDLPPELHMPVPLVESWQNFKIAGNRYPLSAKDEVVVDELFDSLHKKDKFEWARGPTPFGCPVFVVWKMINSKLSSRPVIDMRPINKYAIFDAYSMPRQEEVIESLRGMAFITVIDGSKFFFQFLVKEEHRDKFTVISHRGLERSKVALMSFKNSGAHAQRVMDSKLRPFHHFARAFIDDMVVFSKTKEKHLHHLRQIFELFVEMRLHLSPVKSFLGYPSVHLLGHRLLETYLGMTGWLCPYVPFYAQLSEPLQQRKTQMLARGREQRAVTKTKRKNFCARTSWEPTEQEKAAWDSIQSYLSSKRVLVHHDPEKWLFFKIDASKLTSPAEKHYHPTQQEVACLVYTCRRLRVMIQSNNHPVQVLTGHSATRDSATKANMRLVIASSYLSQFNLEVRHIPGKTNIVPDALSRLEAISPRDVSNDNTLDDLYLASEIIIGPEYKPGWEEKKQIPLDSQVEGVPFLPQDGFLFHIPHKGPNRLCIPSTVLHDVLSEAHDKHHFGLERMRQELAGFAIRRLTKKLLEYFMHRPSCRFSNSTTPQFPADIDLPKKDPAAPRHANPPAISSKRSLNGTISHPRKLGASGGRYIGDGGDGDGDGGYGGNVAPLESYTAQFFSGGDFALVGSCAKEDVATELAAGNGGCGGGRGS
ncbi:uncharacterized protein PAC_15138 [Phialocephala subalpina]|uniref:Reverse transcriptase domain-containing protein n=1 Tax=Phialocephala subalpina TaxID=576137 RepID=A0A1L7XJP3_9HELO|nr:uncharacterized protein PAC_15138 [Phialocephala subalpina]